MIGSGALGDENKVSTEPEGPVARAIEASHVLEATRPHQRDQLAVGVHAAREALGLDDSGLRREVRLLDVQPAQLDVERLALQEVRLADLRPEWLLREPR